MKPPPLLRALKPPVLPPPPRSNAEPVPRLVEDTGPRPRAVLRVGRYEVDARIAMGGMATVHLGRVLGAAGFSRIVAIKRLLPQFANDPEFESMFVAEAQLAARIHHPNVVPTLDVVSSDGELLLVMEYVAGESLARLTISARDAGDMPQPVALAIVCDALHGLHAAHEANDRHGKPLGIVHRDMSPQNVIVGTDGVARVIDFGIAKAANSVNITREGMVRGKAAYMAPEQLSCEALTRRTDIYPLGVMLWELLVGDRLFPGGTRPDLIAKVEGRIPRPKSRVPGLSPKLDAITMRALSTNESDRFATALEMAQALESAAPVAPRSQVAPWVERHARAALAERAALLSLVEAAARSVPPPATSVSAPVGLDLVSRESLQAPGVPSVSVPNLAFTPHEVSNPAAPGARPKQRRAAWLAGAAGVGLLSVVGLAFALRSPRSAETSAAEEKPVAAVAPVKVVPAEPARALAAAKSPGVPQQPAASAPPAAPGAVEPVSVEAAAAAPAPVVVPASARPAALAAAAPPHAKVPKAREAAKAPASKATKSPPKAKNCSPPYTTDAQGRRKYKAECF